jgi:hypothetical protein
MIARHTPTDWISREFPFVSVIFLVSFESDFSTAGGMLLLQFFNRFANFVS